MSTILDELVVVLGLQSKGLDSGAAAAQKKLEAIEDAGAKAVTQTDRLGTRLDVVGEKALDASEAAEKHAKATKKVSETSDTAAKGVSNLSGKMASFLALIGGTVAIRAFIKDAIETNTQLYFMSRNLDMSVQGLYALGAAAQEIGIGKGSLQQLAASLKQIPGQLLAGQTPTLLPLLARAGISFDQSPQQIMVGLARYFATMPASIALGLGTSYGLSYDQMTFLLQGVQKVQAAFDRDKAFAPTTAQARQFAAMKQQIADIGLAFTKLGYDLLSKAAPILEKVFDLLMRFGNWAQQHERLVSSFLVALAAGIGGVSVAALALGASLIEFDPIVLAIVGAIAALSAAITFLVQDYQAWANGQKSTFDWEAFTRLVRNAGDAFDYLKNKIEGLGDAWNRFAQTPPGRMITSLADSIANQIIPPGAINQTSDFTRRIGQAIARQEGFYTAGTIPQRANNPGDIEWGDFARRHGATSYITAAGGHQIAVFPDTGTGWDALYALWDSKIGAGKSVLDALEDLSGHEPGYAAKVLANAGLPANTTEPPTKWGHESYRTESAPAGESWWLRLRDWDQNVGRAIDNWFLYGHSNPHQLSSNTHTDNSVTNNVGTVNINGNGQMASMTPGVARGMDWTTLLMQGNYGLTG